MPGNKTTYDPSNIHSAGWLCIPPGRRREASGRTATNCRRLDVEMIGHCLIEQANSDVMASFSQLALSINDLITQLCEVLEHSMASW